MHEKAKEIIQKKIQRIIDENKFSKRSKEHPEECPCYSQVPLRTCHNTLPDNHNCLWCFCPEYDLTIEEGGCKINNPLGKGKWFFHESFLKGKIWDCSDCSWPHEEENVRKYLMKFFGLGEE